MLYVMYQCIVLQQPVFYEVDNFRGGPQVPKLNNLAGFSVDTGVILFLNMKYTGEQGTISPTRLHSLC
jgi:hypothetical protein